MNFNFFSFPPSPNPLSFLEDLDSPPHLAPPPHPVDDQFGSKETKNEVPMEEKSYEINSDCFKFFDESDSEQLSDPNKDVIDLSNDVDVVDLTMNCTDDSIIDFINNSSLPNPYIPGAIPPQLNSDEISLLPMEPQQTLEPRLDRQFTDVRITNIIHFLPKDSKNNISALMNLITLKRNIYYEENISKFLRGISCANSNAFQTEILFNVNGRELTLRLSIIQFVLLFHSFPTRNKQYTLSGINGEVIRHSNYSTMLNLCKLKIDGQEFEFPFIFFLLASHHHFEAYFDKSKFINEYLKLGSLQHTRFPFSLGSPCIVRRLILDLSNLLPLKDYFGKIFKNTPFYQNLHRLQLILNFDNTFPTLNLNLVNLETAIDYIEEFFNAPQTWVKTTNATIIDTPKITLKTHDVSLIKYAPKKQNEKNTIVNETNQTVPDTLVNNTEATNHPIILSEASSHVVDSNTVNVDSSSAENIPTEASNHVEESNTVNVNSLSAENIKLLQPQLFNLVIKTWRDNKQLFTELNQAMFTQKGNCLIYIEDLSSEMKSKFFQPFIQFLDKNRQHKKEAIYCLKNFFSHFGIACKSLNHVPKPLKKVFSVVEKSECGSLSSKYASYLIPSLLELKIQQFPRKTNNVQTDPINLSLPCGVIKVHQTKAIIIPSLMNIHREDDINWNDDIISLEEDDNNQCFNYIREKLNDTEVISVNKDGIIEIGLSGMKELLNIIKNQEQADFYFLPYSLKVTKSNDVTIESSEEIDPMEIEEIDNTAEEIDLSNKRILGKRAVKPISQEEIATDLLNSKPKKQKVVEESTMDTSYSSKTKKRRAKDKRVTEFEIDSKSSIFKNAQNINTEEGDLVSIRENDLSNNEKRKLGLDASLFDFFINTLTEATEVIEKNTSLINTFELEKIKYPILNQLAQVPETSVEVFPYARILKPYQQVVLNKFATMSQAGITCLISPAMGLGKTPIYMSIIMDEIAKKERGISVIIVPAATRKKTMKELYFWFSEMKTTAYLAQANQKKDNFISNWFYDFLKAKFNIYVHKNKLTYWENWKPLLSCIHRINVDKLPKNALNQSEVADNLQYALDMHLENIFKKNPELFEKIQSIENINFDEDGIFTFNPDLKLSERVLIAQNIMKVLHPNFKDLPSNVTLEEAQLNRLINFKFENFSRVSNAKKSKISIKARNEKKVLHHKPLQQILENENAVLILGYEEFKKLCSEEEINKSERNLFNTLTRVAIADEAQKYHTDGSGIEKIMEEYSKSLLEFNAKLIPVTATGFENKLNELVKLLAISNPDLINVRDINAIQKLQKKALELFSDLVIDSSERKLIPSKEWIIKAFVQSYIFSEILKKIVISLKFTDSNVKEDWQELLPVANIKKYDISYDNPILIQKVQNAINNVFSRYSKAKKKDLTILSMGPCIKRLETDCTLQISSQTDKPNKNSYLQFKNDTLLQNTVQRLPFKIEEFKNGNAKALDEHLIAKICIEHPEISQVIKNENKVIIGYIYEIEAVMLEKIISSYYQKKVFTFGENDKIRNKNLKDFEHCDEPSILLLPVKAGGVGLNLGFVDHMIMINPHWNPAVKMQFFFRILRVGRGGVRNIYALNYDNTYNDFLRCLIKEKTRQGDFYLDDKISLEEKFELFMKFMLKKSLRNFLLSSSIPGFYPIKKQMFPILEKSEDAKNPRSLQRILKEKIQEIQQGMDYDSLQNLIERSTYIVEKSTNEIDDAMEVVEPLSESSQQIVEVPVELSKKDTTLPYNEWKIIPFPQRKELSLEDFSRLANFIANPENKKIVNFHLFNLVKFLAKPDNKKVVDLARMDGDRGVLELLKLAQEETDRPTQSASYYFENGRFELDKKAYREYSSMMPKLYVKNENGRLRVDMLISNEEFNKILNKIA